MTTALIYSILPLLVIFAAAVLVRRIHHSDLSETESSDRWEQSPLDALCLTVVERVFDPTDYVWLRDNIGFPGLAQSLSRTRRQMAIKWLKALRSSFNDLVATYDPVTADAAPPNDPGSWELLWLTLRFHLLLTYATLVVRLFGPYHRLVPPLGAMRTHSARPPHQGRYGTVDFSNLR